MKIDVSKLLKSKGIRVSYAAPYIFRNVEYAASALRRVIRGESYLKEDQIVNLAELLEVPVSSLYGENSWVSKGGVHQFFIRGVRVTMSGEKATYKTNKNETKTIHIGGYTVSEFINQLNNINNEK